MHLRLIFGFAVFAAIGFSGNTFQDCLKTLMTGIPREAANRSDRFLGKIDGRFQTHPKLAGPPRSAPEGSRRSMA
jgi:hypothetical protein